MRIIAAVAAFGVASVAQAQSAESVMEKATRAYSAMQSMRAEFRQTITNPLTGTTADSKGVILRRQPNLLSINFTDPKGDRVVADGKSLWVYLPSSAPGQVIQMPASTRNSLSLVDPGQIFLSSPGTRYTISSEGVETVGGRRTTLLSLVPKRGNNAFSRARVWIDPADGSIRQFEVVDANGLTRLVRMLSLRSNVTIARSEFTFRTPANVRVISSASLQGM